MSQEMTVREGANM